MNVKHQLAAAALAGVFALQPGAASAYSAIIAFGDSLSDAGNVFTATGGILPGAPYSNGHFSNGPTWVEVLANKIGVGPLKPFLQGGTDFAFGGAGTGLPIPGATPTVPSVQQQVGIFGLTVGGAAPADALYTMWIGANDLFDIAAGLKSALIDQSQLGSLVAGAAQSAAQAVQGLAALGAKHILIPLVPDLGKVPRFVGTPAEGLASAMSAFFDANLVADVTALIGPASLDVQFLDTFSLLNDAVANPGTYGLTDVTSACYVGTFLGGGTVCPDPAGSLFWDDIHPTQTGHAIIAEIAAILVPEPGTLVALASGLAGLMVVRRRRVAAAA